MSQDISQKKPASPASSAPHEAPTWLAATPAIFVFLWATGFIGARFGLPYAEPFTFLLYRFAIVCVCLLILALILKRSWPANLSAVGHNAMTGFLLHGCYLGGVFFSLSLGMPAGISALIVGFQPLLTATLSGPLLGEKVTAKQWLGFVIGLGGLLCVLAPHYTPGIEGKITALSLFASIVALLGITFGTIYQKAFATGQDLTTGGFVQYAAASIAVGLLALGLETMEIKWTYEFIGALGWLVFVLSIGAISLLMLIIRHGEVSKIATLFYLVPPITALMAYILFGEDMSAIQIVGFALAAFAVWLAGRKS